MRPLLPLLLLAACNSPSTMKMMDPGPTNALVMARPYELNVPASYDGTKAVPAVIMLHGYSATPYVEEAVFQLTPLSEQRGFIYAMPQGTSNSMGAPFWNATDACCDFEHSNVDDVAYLNAVIDDLQARFKIDPKMIFMTGHSNGGYMTHRMACDSASKLAAVVSLAGAVWQDASKCNPSEPVPVLEVHGDMDTEVPYNGMGATPSAMQTVATWAAKDGCAGPSLTPTGQTYDLIPALPGAETSAAAYACTGHAAAELWTMHGAGHVPDFAHPEWGNDILDWMYAHARP